MDSEEAGSVTYTASTVAKWFIAYAEADEADLSNLKLQKLLYYAQGHYLAEYGSPLFDDAIQAWAHGPVVPAVYHEYKHCGSGDIQLGDGDPFLFEDIDSATSDFLARVWNTYGEFAAWRLRDMTHNEKPWRLTFDLEKKHTVIPIQLLVEQFQRHTAA